MIGSWFEVIKDFKFEPEETRLGGWNPKEGPHVNLSSVGFKGKDEKEAIEMISDTLLHEGSHAAFHHITNKTMLKNYKLICVELNEIIASILQDEMDKAELNEEEVMEAIKTLASHDFLDELFAGRSQKSSPGATRLWLEKYHHQNTKVFKNVLESHVEDTKKRLYNIDVGIPLLNMMLQGKVDAAIEIVHEQFLPPIIQYYHVNFENMMMKLVVKEQKMGISDEYISILRKVVAQGKWERLQEFLDKDKDEL